MPRILKDCFGTVISSLKKMKECVRCELLRECRAINWNEKAEEGPPVVVRRPTGTDDEAASPGEDGS